jgi:hypothetical protein
MPEYDICRYIEKRYDKRIEAENEAQALKIAENLTDEQWGDPETTVNDEIIVFNLTGDVLERSER